MPGGGTQPRRGIQAIEQCVDRRCVLDAGNGPFSDGTDVLMEPVRPPIRQGMESSAQDGSLRIDDPMGRQVAIITGASSGLGAGTAAVFARAGWDVALAARSADPLQGVANSLTDAGGSALAVPTDVADPEAVDALVARTLDRFGQVDVLVNNAAIEHPGSIEELTVAQWRAVVDVNLNGVFYATKAVFGPMRSRGSGYIVNISSVAGLRGFANTSSYCTTKFALTGLTQALAREGAPHGIRASLVYPGGMDTNWHDTKKPEFLKPEDVGEFLLHLVTRPPGFVLNEVIATPIGEQAYP